MSERKENILRIRSRIEESALRSGRSASDVTLIAVSKTFPAEAVREVASYGQVDFGENKVQELVSKESEIGTNYAGHELRWHFIGHLQRNKSKDIIEKCVLFHALDSERLAQSLNSRLVAADTTLDCLIQVNVSGEDSKFGLSPDQVDGFMDFMYTLPAIRPVGLMTLASPSKDPEDVRGQFALLRNVGERVSDRVHAGPGPILSMGMSSDFHVAIEEGATHVRVGSALFGARTYR